MKLEVGKSYKNRAGEVVKIIDNTDCRYNSRYPFKGYNKDQTFKENGTYWSDGVEDERDLIEEVDFSDDLPEYPVSSEIVSHFASNTTLTLTLPSGTESFTGQIKDELGRTFEVTLKRRG